MAITIGIPFYNAQEFLGDAIRSVFAQTYQDWELILVDDGSTDCSLEIAHSIKDSRVRVISDGLNRKLPFRLNQITEEARYEFIGRMDADDIISPFRFEKQLAVLKDNPKIDLVTTGVCSISDDARPVGVRCGSPNNIITGRKLLVGQASVVHAAILGRKAWFQRNPYDETLMLMEDYELWLRAFSQGDFNVYVMSEPLYYYREEGNAKISKLIKAYRNQIEQIRIYGHLGYTPLGSHVLRVKFYSKIAIASLLGLLNFTKLLLKNRNDSLKNEEIVKQFFREIETVRNTKLPR